MPRREPPTTSPERLQIVTVAAGTVLHRVHATTEDPCLSKVFSPNPFHGGRFDSQDSSMGHAYAADTECAAIYETVLRDQVFDRDGMPRAIARSKVSGLSVARLHLRRDATFARLFDLDDLSLVGQEDEWLLVCDASDYFATQAWAAAIVAWHPGIDGIVWKPRFGRPASSFVSYEPPVGTGLYDLDSTEELLGPALARLNDCLRQRRATIAAR